MNFAKKGLIFFIIVMLIVIPFATTAFAQMGADDDDKEGNSGGKMLFDLLLIRPVGILATVIGSALFVVSLPFSAIGGNTKPAYKKMVKEPAKYTFTRPLGEY